MEGSPKLLDLMSKRKWHVKREEEAIFEKNLQLTLGPPGDDNSTNINNSQASLGYFSEMITIPLTFKTNPNSPQSSPSWSSTTASFLQLQSSCSATIQGKVAVVQKESSQPCCTKVVELQQPAGKKTFSAINTAVHSSAQKRIAPAPVVGWPPIRSFRKNLASSSSLKLSSEIPDVNPNKSARAGEKPAENNQKGLFVKINMDGIPIGRKVDLKAYDSYEKLSSAVDELFRGLLAAQSVSSDNGAQKKNEGKTIICGLLDGSGEYTLVYEDNEGDRMLVGDVPWNMFVSTVKRLRVLKTSELPMLCRGAKQGNITIKS